MKGITAAVLFFALMTINQTLQVHAKIKRIRKWVQVKESISDLEEKVVQLNESIATLSDQVKPLTGLPSFLEQLGGMLGSLEEKLAKCTEKTCPEGWSEFQQSCYLLVDKEMTWTAANETCHAMGKCSILFQINISVRPTFKVLCHMNWFYIRRSRWF